MDNKYLKALIKTDTKAVEKAERTAYMNYRGEEINKLYFIAALYVLALDAKNENVDVTSYDSFLETVAPSDEMKNILDISVSRIWDIVVDNRNKFTLEEIYAYILFKIKFDEKRTGTFSTPASILKLANNILDIQEKENVLELCSGSGDFVTELATEDVKCTYKGIEINYIANAIAIIRNEILETDAEYVLADAFEDRTSEKADKIFSNYPWGIRGQTLFRYKESIKRNSGIDDQILHRASSDWVFNEVIMEDLAEDGRAIAIISPASLWNLNDMKIRKYFIENGFVEAIIDLPAKLFSYTTINPVMMVLSRNNRFVRFVDAKELYSQSGRDNILSNNDIEKILLSLDNDSEISIRISTGEIAEKGYTLDPSKYLTVKPEIKNGVVLGSVIKNITRGAQLKAEELDALKSKTPTAFKFLMLSNIEDGIVTIDDKQYLSNIPENLNKYCVSDNAIVIVKTGKPPYKSAVVNVEDGTRILATGNMYVIEIDENKMDSNYIQSFLISDIGQTILQDMYVGTVIQTLSVNTLKEMIVPCPSLEIQKEVGKEYAATIDEIVLIRRKLENAIEKSKHVYGEDSSC